MLRQAAERTGDVVDGTSVSTILAHALFADGVRNVAAGASNRSQARPRPRRQGRHRALKAMSRPVTTQGKGANCGVSAHNDEAVGEMVADAMEKVGNDGVITVEESRRRRQCSKSSKACSSTAVSSHPISSPVPKEWRRCSRTSGALCDHKIAALKDMLPARRDRQDGATAAGDRRG
jgi:chaperonin GroEL